MALMSSRNVFVELILELAALALILTAAGPGLAVLIIFTVLVPHVAAGVFVGAAAIFGVVRVVNRQP